MFENIIQLNEDLIKHDSIDFVLSSVEETLNAVFLGNSSNCIQNGRINGDYHITGSSRSDDCGYCNNNV